MFVANYIFQEILKDARAADKHPGEVASRKWFRDQALSIRSITPGRMMSDEASLYRHIRENDIGRMYQFFYNPKHKRTLPYYDTFPIIFPIEPYPDGFLGINLHYLSPMLRAYLMDALYDIQIDDRVRDSKKLMASYGLLKGASKFKYFVPCIKRYLNSKVHSRFLYIPYNHWDMALFLPTERFKKRSKSFVWRESQKKISKL